jgi:RNA polymerase sigma-70 factor (ECF subfamily)
VTSDGDVHGWQSEIGARLRSGDRSALIELYDQMGSFVYGVALRITASQQVAENITEQVFLGVWTHPEELDGYGDKIRTRLAVLTHDRAVGAVHHARDTSAPRGDAAGEDAGEPVRFSDGQELAEALSTASRVQGALADLGAEQRLALEVTYFGGNTYEATAAILGVPCSVVAEQVGTALRQVSRVLDPRAGEGTQVIRLDDGAVTARDQVVGGVESDGARRRTGGRG